MTERGVEVTVDGRAREQTQIFDRLLVERIEIIGGKEHDRISVDEQTAAQIPTEIDGGPGINTINGVTKIVGTAQPERVEVRMETGFEEGDDEGEGGPFVDVHVTVNGETSTVTFFHSGSVVLEQLDAKDVVVFDLPAGGGLAAIRIGWASTTFDGGLLFTGTAGPDVFNLENGRGGLLATRNGEALGPVLTGKVNGVSVRTGGGDGRIDGNVAVHVIQRAGALRQLGASFVPLTIRAGSGDDRVTCRGRAQRCTVLAGPGDDRIDARDRTHSVVDGGPGVDRVRADRGDRVRRAEVVSRS